MIGTRFNSLTLCLSVTHAHTRTHIERNEMIQVIALRVPAGQLSKCDIFISVEDRAVNPRCLLSSVPDQTTTNMRFITGEERKKNLFKKPLNQPLLNEQAGVRTCLCPTWLCSRCFTLDLPPAVCFFSILF